MRVVKNFSQDVAYSIQFVNHLGHGILLVIGYNRYTTTAAAIITAQDKTFKGKSITSKENTITITSIAAWIKLNIAFIVV